MFNKRLCYGCSVLQTLFNKSPVVIMWHYTVATHGETAASGGSVEERDWSNKSSKRMSNKKNDSKDVNLWRSQQDK